MDESGKGFLNSAEQKVFIFGGVILDRSNVYNALRDFKVVFQKHKQKLREIINQQIPHENGSQVKSDRIHNMFSEFELHAAYLFNPEREDVRKGNVIKENPWKFYPNEVRMELVNEVFKAIDPYIEKIYMFKIDRSSFTDFCNDINSKPTDILSYQLLIPNVLKEYDSWLETNGGTGVIIPDRLDSKIRELFVEFLQDKSLQNLWSEPITVESYTNAFTQIIDLITYCFYVVYTDAQHKQNYKAIKRVYFKYLGKHIEIKDLVKKLREDLEEE
ncbi:DUF3800 domain-containing protein [Lysinibacillus sp. PWR01]|uniref:DUF3800 domain-containing protein n=1 Tax=Lysinibacillus sp. PWR01 TaxID=3342384 RepID=UPI00372D6220